jgi:hypothetical protein
MRPGQQRHKEARAVAEREARLVDQTNWPRDFIEFNDQRSGPARYLASAKEWKQRAAFLRRCLPAAVNGRPVVRVDAPDRGPNSVPREVYMRAKRRADVFGVPKADG